MRVLVKQRKYIDNLGNYFWKPEGAFRVIAESEEFYQIEKKYKKHWWSEPVMGYQWVPKDGMATRCEKVKGWYV